MKVASLPEQEGIRPETVYTKVVRPKS